MRHRVRHLDVVHIHLHRGRFRRRGRRWVVRAAHAVRHTQRLVRWGLLMALFRAVHRHPDRHGVFPSAAVDNKERVGYDGVCTTHHY